MSQDSAGTHDPTSSRTPPRPVDNTDWLKTVAIICVSAGHFGFFFMDDEQWCRCGATAAIGIGRPPTNIELRVAAVSPAEPLHEGQSRDRGNVERRG